MSSSRGNLKGRRKCKAFQNLKAWLSELPVLYIIWEKSSSFTYWEAGLHSSNFTQWDHYTHIVYCIFCKSYFIKYKRKALLSHSGRLAFFLPSSPNKTSITHLVNEPEEPHKAPFCLIPIPLKKGWSSWSLLLLLLGWNQSHGTRKLTRFQLFPSSLARKPLKFII